MLNSNLMIPDFPHNIRIRLAQLKFLFIASCLCPVGCLSLEKLNLNSKQLRFHGAHPNVGVAVVAGVD